MNFLNNKCTEKEFDENKYKWTSIIILSLLFLCGIIYFFFFMFFPAQSGQVLETKDSWTFYSKNAPEFQYSSRYVDKIPRVTKNETFVMEIELDQKSNQKDLLIKGNHQWIKVLLDQEVLYERSAQENEKNPGLSLAIVNLPEDYANRTLQIEVTSPYNNYAGLPPEIYIGNVHSMVSFIFSRSIPQILTMILAVLLAIGTFSYCIYMMYKEKKFHISLVILSTFAFSVGFEALSDDILSSVLFEPIVHSILSHLFSVLTPILLITYYFTKMEYYRKRYGIWIFLHVTMILSVLAYALFTPADLPEVMPFANAISVFSTLCTSLACIGESYKNNRFFVICTPWIVLIAIMHCFLYIQNALGIHTTSVNWSTILFVVILVVMCGYNILEHIEKYSKNQKQVNFLQTKTELLEEHYDLLRSHLKEIGELRGELVQNLENLQHLNQYAAKEEADQFLEKMLDDAHNFELIDSFSGHQLTNLLLARYQAITEKRSIHTTFDVDLPSKLNISDDDLSKLLIHVLEHSIREVRAVENPLQRKINLNIRLVNNKVVIHCEHNTHHNINIFDRGITEELKEQERFDLEVIKKVADKYAGHFSQEKGDIIERITLRLDNDKD
ncbi:MULTISPECIES: hypothetical protein [unclassified Enterococcus]|jgi:uncharacterized membrane-anchored protein YhcB (DUF1043 family)|uniref:hypothetical protein n=1 Tax=unclassified Enterococcus TaxID=2608891 RepID=UPI003D296321